MKVLIVDDGKDVRRLLRYIVEEKGHEPVEARDGREGLREAGLHMPDLIISDALMPVMDGFQFLKAVKKDDRLRHIPFIFYSSVYRADKDVDLAIALGAEGYIIKPKEPSELWEEVEIILQGQKTEKVITPELITEEADYLKRYSQVVAAKLEENVAELEREIAERTRAEREVRKTKEEWERTFDAISDPVMILDTGYRIVKANKAMSAALGMVPDAVKGLTCYEVVHGAKEPPAFCPLAMLLRDSEPRSAEISEPRLGGHFIVSVSPLVTPEGTLYGAIHYARDISERKRNEDALKKSNELLERIFSTTHILIAYLDREFNFIKVNRAYAEVNGRDPAFFIGKNHFVLYPDAENEAIFRKVVETGEPFVVYGRPFEYADHPERGVTYWDWSVVPVLNADGTVDSLVFSLKDVTERRRAEEKNRQLAAIVESSDDAIIGKTLDGTILTWNKGAERIYGYREEEIAGRPISVLIPEGRMGELAGILQSVREGKPVERFETVRARKDGGRIHVSLTVSPVRDTAGKIVGASAIARDITERKKLEDQLRHAQKIEAVGTLAGGIAHDFNNILSAVMGYADLMLLKIAGGDPLRRDAEEILSAAGRAAQLTRSLLAFSRKQEMDLKPVDLNQVILGVEKFLARVIGENIELKTALHGKPLMVNADSGQMEQMVINLAVNARDAMPRGGMLAIETKAIDPEEDFVRMHGGGPGPYAMVLLTDSGSGMDEETAKRIFEPFFTTKEAGKGTGLGLAIVYGIVKQHGGYINVYSEPGEGTIFKIYLPLVSPGEMTDAERATETGRRPRGTETILVAEDDAAVRKLIGTVLSEFGYRVIAAEDGQDAISKFSENSDTVSLVVLDMIMPKKNGREAFGEIRKIRPGIKALFASGYTEERARGESLAAEECDFIVKPVAPQELLAKIRDLLDR